MCRRELSHPALAGLFCVLALMPLTSAGAQEARAAIAPEAKGKNGAADNLLGAFSFTSGKEPIAVAANALEFDYQTRVLTYKGQVTASQGDMKLEADSLVIALASGSDPLKTGSQGGDAPKGTSQLKEVVARGNVKLSKGARWATAGEAVFDQTERVAILSKNPVLHDGPNQVTGERVVVYLNDERFVVEGGTGGRVQAVFFPPKGAETAATNPTPSSQP